MTQISSEQLRHFDRKLRFRPGVCAFIPNAYHQFPMGRRKTGKHDDGTWCLPGGGLEWGETISEAVVREAREETGLDVTYTGQLCALTWMNQEHDSYHLTIYTVAQIGSGVEVVLAEPDHFYEWDWFDAEHLPEPLAFPCTRQAAQRFEQYLLNRELLMPETERC